MIFSQSQAQCYLVGGSSSWVASGEPHDGRRTYHTAPSASFSPTKTAVLLQVPHSMCHVCSPRNSMCSRKCARPGRWTGSEAAPTSTDIAAAAFVALGSLMTITYRIHPQKYPSIANRTLFLNLGVGYSCFKTLSARFEYTAVHSGAR